MSRTGAVLSVVVVAVGSACTGARGSRAAAPPPPPPQAQTQTQTQGDTQAQMQAPGRGMGMMGAMCPMGVPGAQVAASDTPDGEAITFTTASPEQVDELRRRVRAMAEMQERHMVMHGEAAPMRQDMGSSGMSGMGSTGAGEPGVQPMEMPPPSRAVAEDVPGGARMTVTPNDRADLERLRQAVRSHADRMRDTGDCGMGQPSQNR